MNFARPPWDQRSLSMSGLVPPPWEGGRGQRKFLIFLRSCYVFHDELGEIHAFQKVGGAENDVAELRIPEDMLFQKYGRRDVERSAHFGKVAEKIRIREGLFALVDRLFYDMIVLIDFRPNAEHISIIANFYAKKQGIMRRGGQRYLTNSRKSVIIVSLKDAVISMQRESRYHL